MMHEFGGGPWEKLGSMVVAFAWWFDDQEPGEARRTYSVIKRSKLINQVHLRHPALSKPALDLDDFGVRFRKENILSIEKLESLIRTKT